MPHNVSDLYFADTTSGSIVTSSVASQVILPANPHRKSAMIFNESPEVLFLKLGNGALYANFSLRMPAYSLYELIKQPLYLGAVTGIWGAASGSAMVTEHS